MEISNEAPVMSNEIVKANQPVDDDQGEPVDPVVFTPPIDIFETPEGLVLLADLPGVTLESLELQVQDNKLTLFGKVKSVIPPEARLIHQEYAVGHFLRSFILSDEVDHERISAKLNQGVLEVVLPQLRKSEPRRIQVTIE
jgi:HSP20 family molecular chaperone IbpA